MTNWEKRQPRPHLIFHTKKERDFGIGGDMAMDRFPMKDILAITTENRMGAASGTFSIDLLYYKIRPDDIEPYYYDVIRPLDLVEIELEAGTTTMIGFVDIVTKEMTITAAGVRQRVRVTGRSLGAIWEFDLVKFFKNALGLDKEWLDRNLRLQTSAIELTFMKQPPFNAVMGIYYQLSAVKIKLWDDKTIKDYLEVGEELYVRPEEKVFARQLSLYQGSIWGYFKRYIYEPFNELWTDSKDGKLYLRSRPTPFSHGNFDPEKAQNVWEKQIEVSWHDIRTWITGELYHEISKSQITQESISINHGKGYSAFVVLSSDKFVGNDSEYAVFKPLVDQDLVDEIGMRDMQHRLPYIPLMEDGATIDGKGGTFERYTFYRNKAYLWNRDNHRMQGGTMTVKGDPNLRVGDRVLRTDLGVDFYITAVRNSFQFGRPFLSTITVDRGLKSADRDALYNDGMEFLKSVV